MRTGVLLPPTILPHATHTTQQIQMRTDEQCKVLCRIEKLTSAQSKAFVDKIEDDYKVNM